MQLGACVCVCVCVCVRAFVIPEAELVGQPNAALWAGFQKVVRRPSELRETTEKV